MRRILRFLPVAAVIGLSLALTSSCSLLAPIIGLPIKMAGSAIQMLGSNPVGAAATAAAVF